MAGRGTMGRRAALVALAGLGTGAAAWARPHAETPPALIALDRLRASTEARRMVAWILAERDHQDRPFGVVDKRNARFFVFDREAQLRGDTKVLLGSTWGDHIVPGVGERAQTNSVRADERTTPAGRFDAAPGINLQGEAVVWVDYASAFAIHRVRPGRSQRPRERVLATMSPDDNRVSNGCVVTPVPFFLGVVQPLLGRCRSVVYVLPEARPLGEVFAAFA